MIKIGISGTLPQIQPMKTVMGSLAMRLGSDIRADVAQGGNPTWPDRVHPPGRAGLGYISSTLQLSSGENFARASFGGGLVFAKVHEMGWMIKRTAKMRKFFWAKWYETKEEFWKGMALSKNEFINIPQRSVISGIYNRKEDYAKFIGQQITITHSLPIAKG